MPLSNKIIQDAITFDDVLLVPSYSEVLPNQVSLTTRLTDKIQLNIPLVSAAMDTVSEAKLAIALAREGGLSFIHKNMSIQEQAAQVDTVKRSENGMISDPITLSRHHKLQDAEDLMRQYSISCLLVIEEDRMLVGIITNRDIRYQTNMDQLVEAVMTKENIIDKLKKELMPKKKNIIIILNTN